MWWWWCLILILARVVEIANPKNYQKSRPVATYVLEYMRRSKRYTSVGACGFGVGVLKTKRDAYVSVCSFACVLSVLRAEEKGGGVDKLDLPGKGSCGLFLNCAP